MRSDVRTLEGLPVGDAYRTPVRGLRGENYRDAELLVKRTGDLALQACTRPPSPLDEAQVAEIEALQLEAQRIDDAGGFDIASDAGWEQLGPGVWRLLTFDEGGALVGEGVEATGHGAFA